MTITNYCPTRACYNRIAPPASIVRFALIYGSKAALLVAAIWAGTKFVLQPTGHLLNHHSNHTSVGNHGLADTVLEIELGFIAGIFAAIPIAAGVSAMALAVQHFKSWQEAEQQAPSPITSLASIAPPASLRRYLAIYAPKTIALAGASYALCTYVIRPVGHSIAFSLDGNNTIKHTHTKVTAVFELFFGVMGIFMVGCVAAYVCLGVIEGVKYTSDTFHEWRAQAIRLEALHIDTEAAVTTRTE